MSTNHVLGTVQNFFFIKYLKSSIKKILFAF